MILVEMNSVLDFSCVILEEITIFFDLGLEILSIIISHALISSISSDQMFW
jgi:hypothetical protein